MVHPNQSTFIPAGQQHRLTNPGKTPCVMIEVQSGVYLVEADIVDGRTLTGWPSIRTDLENAGADVVDEEVVVDDNFITSRNPDDIPAFSQALIDALLADDDEDDEDEAEDEEEQEEL
jgi:hypothetical protein